MLRSLVGSEMCIRDRYQRRVRGTHAANMMRIVLATLAVIVIVNASERRAMFFAEQRADRIAYIGWPPLNCHTDDQCKGINGSYCMNDTTKTPPYFCHEPLNTLVGGLSKPVGCSIDSSTQKVFYTEDDQSGGDTQWPLSVVNVDGTGKGQVIPKLLDPQGIDLDTKNQKVYYTEHHGQRVGVVNYDGSGRKVLHTFTGSAIYPSDVVCDLENGFLFVQVETQLSTGGQLVRMGLDGSNVTVIVNDIVRAYGITVNPATKTAYYVSGGHGGFVANVSYDGTSPGVVLGGLEWPFEIDFDKDMNKLVFSTTGVGDGKIQTMKLDGTDIEDVQELGFAPMGVSFGALPVEESLVAPLTDVYCMIKPKPAQPPFYCHAPPLPTSCKTDKDCVTPWYNSYCQNKFACKQELPPTCTKDSDCVR
eukprot:TRINITY_DN463_c0_g1_i1.p1 TRINITY_DN463_c0_g1~~TRINITY_DN463_c0_g1_i1.p1  ORF type:complete len:419 (+),score=127.22 TRINITY_DN463_c0_g1_i1:148-1404(+)